MLEIRDLHAGYGHMKVLHGIDLTIGTGEIVALLGSNGAGKSTLNNNISGLYKPTGGAILFEGQNITGLRSEAVVDLGIIQVPEGRRIFPNMSIRENLELGGYRRGKANRATNMERVVSVFPRLSERFDQFAGTLSGGEQQMLAIGRALMTNPKLLILDEATEGLAPLVRQKIWAALNLIAKDNMSILVVDKNLKDLLKIANRNYIIQRGKIVWSGTSDELRQDRDALHNYLGV